VVKLKTFFVTQGRKKMSMRVPGSPPLARNAFQATLPSLDESVTSPRERPFAKRVVRPALPPLEEVFISPREKPLGKRMVRSRSGVFREKKMPPLPLGNTFYTSDPAASPLASDRELLRKMSRTDADLPQRVSRVNVPTPLFLKCVSNPVVSCQEWEERVNRALLKALLNTSSPSENKNGIIKKLFKNLLNYSSILERVSRAAELSKGELADELKKLEGEAQPVRFWKGYFPLFEKDDLFCEIMGGKEALKIIHKAVDAKGKTIQGYFGRQIEKFVSSENKRIELLESSFQFQRGFDLMKPYPGAIPVFLAKEGDVVGAFRAFVSDGPFAEDAIAINKENVKIPSYNDLNVGPNDREEYFTEWMISTLQKKLSIDNAVLKPSEQIELFAATVKTDARLSKLKSHIIKHLGDEFALGANESEMFIKFTTFLIKLKKEKETEDFVNQMSFHAAFVSKYLYLHEDFAKYQHEDAAKKDWSRIADALIGLYRDAYKIQEKHKKIPLLAVLKSISFPAYGSGEHFLRQYLCPDLSPLMNNANFCNYQLRLDRDFITSYSVTSRDKRSFENIHKKRFKIVHVEEKKMEIGPPGQIKIFTELVINKVKASLSIDWAIEGELGSIEYGARMEITKFDFLPECSIDERESITSRFHLECGSTSWGHYLKRVVIKSYVVNRQRENSRGLMTTSCPLFL
jgi:hypothetical protein